MKTYYIWLIRILEIRQLFIYLLFYYQRFDSYPRISLSELKKAATTLSWMTPKQRHEKGNFIFCVWLFYHRYTIFFFFEFSKASSSCAIFQVCFTHLSLNLVLSKRSRLALGMVETDILLEHQMWTNPTFCC